MQGNAGAGGAFLALAADRVYARDGVVLNPHYKSMGNLYGSEYWTYLLPRRVDMRARARRSCRIGFRSARGRPRRSGSSTPASARRLPRSSPKSTRARGRSAPIPGSHPRLAEKNARRAADEARKPLSAYRDDELARMRQNFFGFDPSYHVARYHFVAKVPRSRTPLWLARHRAASGARPAAVRGGGLLAPRQAATAIPMEP